LNNPCRRTWSRRKVHCQHIMLNALAGHPWNQQQQHCQREAFSPFSH
jgi:hypothetical protein